MVRSLEDFGHGRFHCLSHLDRVLRRLLLPVIGKNPDIIIAARRTMRRLPDSFDGAVNSLERPMREERIGSAAMRLLVVTEEVHVNNRQPAVNIHFGSDYDNFPHNDANEDPQKNEAELKS